MPEVLTQPVNDKIAQIFRTYLGGADALRLNLHADVGNPYSGFVNIGEKEGAGIVRR